MFEFSIRLEGVLFPDATSWEILGSIGELVPWCAGLHELTSFESGCMFINDVRIIVRGHGNEFHLAINRASCLMKHIEVKVRLIFRYRRRCRGREGLQRRLIFHHCSI